MRSVKEDKKFSVESLGVQEIDVYDIEVEDNHNFFANGILVHNSDYLNIDPIMKLMGQDVYGDRVKAVKFVDNLVEKAIQPLLNEVFSDLKEYLNFYQQNIYFKREAVSDSSIVVAKKRYAMSVINKEGVQYAEPKVKVQGLEIVRSSTPAVCRGALKDAVKLMLLSTEEATQEFIAKFREEFMAMDYPEVAFPRGANGLEQYSSASHIYGPKCPIAVRGALLFNHYVKEKKLTKKYVLFKSGDKLKFIHLKMPNTIREDVISFQDRIPKELDLEKYIDWETQFAKAFHAPLEKLFIAAGWEIDPKPSLESFFG
jgi:hypothetical protein